jgi:hypothetical protein
MDDHGMIAANAAKEAAANAAIAANVAKEAAISAAVVSTNIDYIKRDIAEIKENMKDVLGRFVTQQDFAEHIKVDVDHEERIRTIEQNMWKWIGASSVAGALISSILGVVIKTFLK